MLKNTDTTREKRILNLNVQGLLATLTRSGSTTLFIGPVRPVARDRLARKLRRAHDGAEQSRHRSKPCMMSLFLFRERNDTIFDFAIECTGSKAIMSVAAHL
jgi:hypothetical protein